MKVGDRVVNTYGGINHGKTARIVALSPSGFGDEGAPTCDMIVEHDGSAQSVAGSDGLHEQNRMYTRTEAWELL